jgi:hypothetical protein
MLGRTLRRGMLGDKDDEEDNLHNRAKGGLNQNTRHLWHLSCELLSSESKEVSYRNHGDVARDENSKW